MITKLSIIIPVYNTSKYLRRCLDSVVNQTLKDIEIIVIDDGSTDDSLEIIKEYMRKYNNIKGYTKDNEGVAKTRNLGINRAKGTYIGFLDSDDYVDPGYYEELYSYAPEYDVIRGIRVIDQNNRHGKNPYGCIIPAIIRRHTIIKNKIFFPDKSVGEDSTFKRWLFNATQSIFECPDKGIYYHYMRRPGSLSNYQLTEN